MPLKSPVPAPARPPPKLNGCAVVVVARPKVPAGFAPNNVLPEIEILIDVSLTVKAATLIFISRRGSAISSAKEGKSGFIYNLVKS